jgi:TonB family protein
MLRTGVLSVALAASLGATGHRPARLTGSGETVEVPPLHGQCQIALEVGVDCEGSVAGVWCLYGGTPLADRLGQAVSHWVFAPATDCGVRNASRVLVAAVFRLPALLNVGPCAPPDSMLAAPAGLPIPVIVAPPTYPVHALGSGVVIVEVEIGASGEVRSAQAIGERSQFDAAAEKAAQAWRFLPARRKGHPVSTVAYLVFGFPKLVPPARPD